MPWVGAYKANETDWVAMNWNEEGMVYSDQTKEGSQIKSGQDIEELAGAARVFRSSQEDSE